MKEIWKDIEGYEGKYQVSNLGRIKSLPRTDRLGRQVKGKIMKQGVDIKGYNKVNLSMNGSYKTFKPHRLVAQAFMANPENKPQVNHIDGNKLNNCVENLEWCTNLENMKHAYVNGLQNRSKGSTHHKAKINEEIAMEIFLAEGTNTKISEEYNVLPQTVYQIKRKKVWKHIHKIVDTE